MSQTNPNRPDLPWLVKASGQILGPFSRDELIEKLRSKEVVLLDEVAQPMSRWKYVRDEPLLAKVVEEIRQGAYAGREDTMTSTTDDVSRALADGTQRLEGEKIGRSSNSDAALVSYGSPDDRTVRVRLSRVTIMIWSVTLFLLSVVAGVIWLSFANQREAHLREASYGTLLQQGLDAERLGDYVKALDFLRRAQQLRPNEVEVDFALAPLMIAVEGQTEGGKRLLAHSLLLKFRPSEAVQARTALSLAALIEGNLDEARQAIDQALSVKNDFYPALTNLGITQYLRGEYTKAQDSFALALKQNPPDDAMIVLLMNLSQIGEIESTTQGGRQRKEDLPEIENALRMFAKGTYDFRQEALLLANDVAVLRSGEVSEANITEILDLDPELTEQHLHDLLIYGKLVAWDSLLPRCRHLVGDKSTPHRMALVAYCLFKAGNHLEARSQIESAIRLAPDDELLKGHYAHILRRLGQDEEAAATLKGLPAVVRFQLPLLMRARTCEALGDFVCVEVTYKKLLNLNPNSIEAMAGLAHLAAKRGEYLEAVELIERGLQLSSTYIPLLQLQWAIHDKVTTPK